MAKAKTNGVFSPEMVKLLSAPDDPATVHAQTRAQVRELFDDGIKEHGDFEDALVAVFAAGMTRVLEAKPKRRRKAKQPEAEA